MFEFENDTFSILNYQGSKKNLMNFIYKNTVDYIDENKAVLDIFSGSCAVAYAFKRYYTVYANDSEYYAYIIADALLSSDTAIGDMTLSEDFFWNYSENIKKAEELVKPPLSDEDKFCKDEDIKGLQLLYENYCTIKDENFSIRFKGEQLMTPSDFRKEKDNIPYILFLVYYSNSYFGIRQALEIDSLRYAIEQEKDSKKRNIMLASLFFAMKECVFSKDGHMAQPLDLYKNENKLLNVRSKSIISIFEKKIMDFSKTNFVIGKSGNAAFNYKLSDIVKTNILNKNVGFIYADPPYTDMQYSRYYHLLNIVARYQYSDLTINRNRYTKGLYSEGRFQSPLSQRSNAKKGIDLLCNSAYNADSNLALSYAYPRNTKKQATDRYTMNIDELIGICERVYGKSNCNVITEEYQHSNNRNAQAKKVLEYLIVCKK